MITPVLDHEVRKLIKIVARYNRVNSVSFAEEEANALQIALEEERNVVEPIQQFVAAVGAADWNGSSLSLEEQVRSGWLKTVAFLNEGGVVDEEVSLLELIAQARSVISIEWYQKRFNEMLDDADLLNASGQERREALWHVIATNGFVSPMKDFMLLSEEELEEVERYDDCGEEEESLLHLIDVERGIELSWRLLLADAKDEENLE
jgi:hypothetical protein